MKQLELELNKRLLIVGFEDKDEAAEIMLSEEFNKNKKFICKGPDLTEEIAEDLVHGFDLGYFVDYNHHNPRSYKLTALESFISSIEANGFWWGTNPVQYPDKNNHKYYDEPFDGKGFYQEIYSSDILEWKNAESRTFNIDKTLIFEIL